MRIGNDCELYSIAAGEDFNASLETTLNFQTLSRQCVNITIASDSIVEEQESFQVVISLNDTSAFILEEGRNATISIDDSTGKSEI